MSIEAMKLALEALEEAHPKPYNESVISHVEAITAIKQALAAPVQEPVAWQGVYDKTDLYYRKPVQGDVRPLYTTPPAAQRQWVGLTDEDWKQLWAEFDSSGIENDFQDHMVSKYGAGHYTDADMYWQFQQQVIKQMVNAVLKVRGQA